MVHDMRMVGSGTARLGVAVPAPHNHEEATMISGENCSPLKGSLPMLVPSITKSYGDDS